MKEGKSIALPLAVSIIAISFSAIFVKLSSAPSSILSMYRLWLASLILLPIVWLKRGELQNIGRKDWQLFGGALVLIGVCIFLMREQTSASYEKNASENMS